jgi:hypothetical protein
MSERGTHVPLHCVYLDHFPAPNNLLDTPGLGQDQVPFSGGL